MTGRYPSATGVLSNDDRLSDSGRQLPTLPQLLLRHAHGRIVTTNVISKVFHQPAATASYDQQPWDRRWDNLSSSSWTHVPRRLRRQLGNGMPPPTKVRRGPGYGHVVEDRFYHMAFRRSVGMLAGLLAQRSPFFFAFGISGTHVPLLPPLRYIERYRADRIQLASTHAPHALQLARKDGFQSYNLTRLQQQEYVASYLASAEYVDAQVGAATDLVARAERSSAFDAANGNARRTAMLVHADHGFHLGEHGRWSKYTLYEEALRVRHTHTHIHTHVHMSTAAGRSTRSMRRL